MHFEARTHVLLPVADAAEAAQKVKAGGINWYQVPTWQANGATFHAVADGHTNSSNMFEETAVLKRVGEMLTQIESITVAWCDLEKVTRYFQECEADEPLNPYRKVTLIVGEPKGDERAWFDCGCCGSGFRGNVKEQLKFDQDAGYGICDDCADGW